MDITGWLIVNSIALLVMVFNAGQSFNRIKSLEYRMKSAEDREEITAAQGNTIATLSAKVDSLKDSVEHVRRGVHDLRNQLTLRN